MREVAPVKFLFLLVLAALLWACWRVRARPKDAPPPVKAEEAMVACAHCGVYLPQSESLTDNQAFYCCEAHRQAGGAAK